MDERAINSEFFGADNSPPELIVDRPADFWSSVGALLGGIACFVFAALGLVASIALRIGQLQMHSMTTLPSIVGFGLLAKWWSSRRSPQRIVVWGQGLELQGSQSRVFPWSAIGWVNDGTTAMGHEKQLTLYDPQGAILAVIVGDFLAYPQLVEAIRRHVAQQQNPTVDKARLKKARRSALLPLIVGVLFFAGSIFLCRDSYENSRLAKLLATQGVPGKAELVRHFTAPNGHTRRIEYRVNATDGRSAVHNAEVEPAIWEGLREAKEVEVLLVPDEPGASRLLVGEVEEKRDWLKEPPGSYVMSALCLVLGIFLFGGGIMQWCGYDFVADSNTGKFGFRKLGEKA